MDKNNVRQGEDMDASEGATTFCLCVCVRLPRSMTHILMSCLEVLPPLGSVLSDNVTSSISLKQS